MSTTSNILDRTIAPAFGVINDLVLPEPQKITFANGQRLFVINGGSQDVVRLELLFPAGKLQETQHLLAQATANLLFSGNSKENAAQIAEKFDYYGAFVDVKAEEDRSVVTLYSLRKNFAETAPLLANVLKEAAFPDNEHEVYIQNQRQRLTINLEKVDFLARRAFFQEVFGEKHPYGYYSTFEAYDVLTRESIVQFYQQQYLNQAPTILLSGKVENAEIETIEKYFTSENPAAVNGNKVSMPPAHGIVKKRVEKKDALQAGLMLGSEMINRQHTDFPGLNFLNTLFGGYFGSRLMTNIREDKGYTYGIHSILGSPKLSGYWVISTEVGAAVADAALAEIYKELDRLHTETIPQEEIDLVRNYTLGNFLRSIDGPFDLADRLKSVLLFDMDYSYYQRWLKEVNTIDSGRLQDLARKYFRKENIVEVIAG